MTAGCRLIGDSLAHVSDLPVLSAEEQRVLGSILEKEITVPGSYPMTVNSIRGACNQASSREPVVDYDERDVHDVLRELKARELVAVTWADSGRRTLKYVQTIAARQGWAPDERALLTVLLLRGAQPPGALKTRTERLHGFADREEVQATLVRMAAADPPLVQEQPKRPREQDHRWVHLLGPVETPAGPPGAVTPDTDREDVLRGGDEARTARVRACFDAVAEPYGEKFTGELEQMPFERWLLARVAAESDGGPVVEVGCGPGHVTAHLATQGAAAQGLDLSVGMVEEARRRYPHLTYDVGDLRRLMRPAASDGWAAVLAWYSMIYFAPSELDDAVASLVRPLAAGGRLVLAMHAGTGILHGDSWFDTEVDLDVVRHDPANVCAAVEAAGLVDVEWYLRGPIASRSETTERLYVLARKPQG